MIKKATRLVAVSLALCFVLVLSANTIKVQAIATKTPITYEFTYTDIGLPEKEWIDDDGIAHMRQTPHLGEVSGELIGITSYTGNLNLNLATFDGDGQGFQILEVEYGSLSGIFEGVMAFEINGGILTGETVCQGSGDFEGMKLMGTISGSLLVMEPVFTFVGIILNPHG